jgi:hypothetical protein
MSWEISARPDKSIDMETKQIVFSAICHMHWIDTFISHYSSTDMTAIYDMMMIMCTVSTVEE